MRIISGIHKNRIIPTQKNSNYRPSLAKTREAIFSMLSSTDLKDINQIEGATILDLYAGSGAFSFEALSRGAKFSTLVDINMVYLNNISLFAKKIGEESKIRIVNVDALKFSESTKFDFIFVDPPYNYALALKTLKHLDKKEMLKNNSLIIVEIAINENLLVDEKFSVIVNKTYNKSRVLILKKKDNEKTKKKI